jgi:hypothetical protein
MRADPITVTPSEKRPAAVIGTLEVMLCGLAAEDAVAGEIRTRPTNDARKRSRRAAARVRLIEWILGDHRAREAQGGRFAGIARDAILRDARCLMGFGRVGV